MEVCGSCGAPLHGGNLACPACNWLVHGERLKQLAAEAQEQETRGEPGEALARWREALEILPPQSAQHRKITERTERLSQAIAAPTVTLRPQKPAWVKRFGPFGGAALLLWKLKFVLVAVLSKAKLLLLGLTKISTLLSMVVSFGAYWALFGWRFGLGLVGSIYVHEMGHVAAMRRFGMPASAPMFIPGFGAFVRLKAHPTTPVEDARIGLAGPLWGLGGTIVTFAIGTWLRSPIWLAIAHTAAWINLFNLLPVWQLDGGRAFAAVAKLGRVLVATVYLAVWAYTREGLLVLLAIVAYARALEKNGPTTSDRTTIVQLTALAVLLGLLAVR